MQLESAETDVSVAKKELQRRTDDAKSLDEFVDFVPAHTAEGSSLLSDGFTVQECDRQVSLRVGQ